MKLLVTSNTKMKNKFMALLAVGLLVGPMAAKAAPGGVTDGLRVWLRADTGISVNDGDVVEVWADQSGEGNDAVFNPANVFGENAPVLDASNPGVAGRPTVRFNNANALELDLGFLVGSDYTIFVVNGRDRNGVANPAIARRSSGLVLCALAMSHSDDVGFLQITRNRNDVSVFGRYDQPTIKSHVHTDGQTRHLLRQPKARLRNDRRSRIGRVGIRISSDRAVLVRDVVGIVDVQDGIDARDIA